MSALCWVVHSAGAREGPSSAGLVAQTLQPCELVHPTHHPQVCAHPPIPAPRCVLIPHPCPQVGQVWSAGELGWHRNGADPEVFGEPRGEGGGGQCMGFAPTSWRKDIPGHCFSNPLLSLLYVFFPSTYLRLILFFLFPTLDT